MVSPAAFGGISPEQSELAKQIQSYRAEAVSEIMTLLKNDNKVVRDFAGYVARDLDGLTESNLDALIAAVRAGDGWIPPAIARIGTPRAIGFLIEQIKSKPQTHTQFTWALSRAGEKSVRALAELYQAPQVVSADLQKVVCQIFSEMGAPATGALPILIETVEQGTGPTENRIGAVRAIGAIGAHAARAVPVLQRLATRDSVTFSKVVESAIVQIGTPEAATILDARLRLAPSVVVLRDIAELGKNGRMAGPAVVGLLQHKDWELRVTAARTLGYIGYIESVSALRQALTNTDDWRLVLTAVGSLGRLQAQAATTDLKQVAQRHWFPPVRDAAEKALRVIDGAETYKSKWQPANFAFEFFDYRDESASAVGLNSGFENQKFAREPNRLNSGELSQMTYPTEVIGYGVKGREVTPIKSIPDCGLRIGKTFLLGSSRGEWGGELVLQDEGGAIRRLIDSNIQGVHQLGSGIVATSGLAHLALNSGCVYRIEIKAGELPVARLWKVLPGAPGRSGLLESGDLFVECRGGNVKISPSGEIRMADQK